MKKNPLNKLLIILLGGMISSSLAGPNISFVPIGDPNNPADSNGRGSVAYDFEISQYEITNDEYVAFLNAVAATDPNGLFNSLMGTDPRGGIAQSGSSGNYTYTVRSNMGNKPVGYISFWDRCRFCNWLHNGCPEGVQSAATTENGAYDLTDSDAITNNSVTRNPEAKFFIPNMDEWHKAAYYDPRSEAQGGPTGDDNYWLYPTQSDSIPTPATANSIGDVSNPGPNVANYSSSADWNGQNGNATSVGTAAATSYYGAYDLGGNAWDVIDLIVGSYRQIRGGGFGSPNRLRATETDGNNLFNVTNELDEHGMRIAALALPPTVDNSALKATIKRQLKGLSKQLKNAKRAKKKSKVKKTKKKISILKRRLRSL